MLRRLSPLVLGGLVVAGCTAPPASSPAPGAPTPAGASSPGAGAPDTGPSGTSGPGGNPASSVTLAFAGDVHFERQLKPLLRDPDAEWTKRLPELAAADFSMVNLETALTERGSPEPKTYTFRTSPVALQKLAAAGVDAVSMANNHAADFGEVGIQDTLDAIGTSPIPVVGFGKDETAAYAPVSADVGGLKVGVIAATEVDEETYRNHSAGPGKPGVAQNVERERFTRAARDAVAAHDVVVAFMHWGTEGSTCPNERQVETARVLSDAGVDVVVGTHAHRPQGSGWQGRTFVGYGTGNFVWYNTSTASRSSGVLSLTVDADAVRARGKDRSGAAPVVSSYEWAPKLISTSGVPETPTASLSRLQQAARAATSCSGLAQRPG